MLYRFQADTSVSLTSPRSWISGFHSRPWCGAIANSTRQNLVPDSGTTLWYTFVVSLLGKYVFILHQTTQTTLLLCNDDVRQSILGNRASKVLCPISISTSLIAPTADILELWSKPSWSVGAVRLMFHREVQLRVWCLLEGKWSWCWHILSHPKFKVYSLQYSEVFLSYSQSI